MRLQASDFETIYPPDYMGRNNSSKLFLFFRSLENLLYVLKIEKICNSFFRDFDDINFLDYGSGNSNLGLLMSKRNRHISALSYDPYVVDKNKFFDSPKLSRFNCISLIYVMEHFQDPIFELEQLKDLMLEESVLLIVTPNASDISFRVFNKFWCFLHYPYHLNIFSRDSLQKMLVASDFKIIQDGTHYAGNTIAYSIENVLKYIFKLTTKGHLKFYSALVMICAPFEFLLWRFRVLQPVLFIVAAKSN